MAERLDLDALRERMESEGVTLSDMEMVVTELEQTRAEVGRLHRETERLKVEIEGLHDIITQAARWFWEMPGLGGSARPELSRKLEEMRKELCPAPSPMEPYLRELPNGDFEKVYPEGWPMPPGPERPNIIRRRNS